MGAKFMIGLIEGYKAAVYVVDDDLGVLLHRDPVCEVDMGDHAWFAEWLKSQPCPYADVPPRKRRTDEELDKVIEMVRRA